MVNDFNPILSSSRQAFATRQSIWINWWITTRTRGPWSKTVRARAHAVSISWAFDSGAPSPPLTCAELPATPSTWLNASQAKAHESDISGKAGRHLRRIEVTRKPAGFLLTRGTTRDISRLGFAHKFLIGALTATRAVMPRTF